MKTSVFVRASIALVIGITLCALQTIPSTAQEPHGKDLLVHSKALVAIAGFFVGHPLPKRDVSGGGFPGVIPSGDASLNEEGKLHVSVTGLVIAPADPTAQ